MTAGEPEETQGTGVSVVGTRTRRPVGPTATERGSRRRLGTRRSTAHDAVDVASPARSPAGEAGESEARSYDERVDPGRGEDRGRLRRTRTVSTGALIGLGALALVAAVAAIGFGLAWANLNGQNSERQAVKQAATTFLLDLTNVKPTTVDADFAALQNWADPGSLFAKQAAQTFNSSIRQGLIQAQASSQGEIRSIFVETIGGSSAEVYAVVDQAYQTAKMTSPQTDTLRLTLDLTDTDHGWRISAVTVENPSGTSSGTTGPTG